MALHIIRPTSELNPSDVDVVASLLVEPFSSRNEIAKSEILRLGRPTPTLSTLASSNVRGRHFQTSWYEKYKWLCGSEFISKLFCWPCLLLSKKSSAWSRGCDDLKNVSRALIRHESTKDHLNAHLMLSVISKTALKYTELINEHSTFQTMKYNEEVRKTREVFKALIDVTCLICKQELCFKLPTDATGISVNQGTFKAILDLILNRNQEMKRHWHNRSAIREISKSIQLQLIELFQEQIKNFIRDEIEKAQFVSCKLEETTDSSGEILCSVAVRMVDSKGDTREYLVGFYEINQYVTSGFIYNVLWNTFEELKVSQEKFVALTYSGSSVKPRQMKQIHEKVREFAPQTIFTYFFAPSQSHILEEVCSKFKPLKDFFDILQGISETIRNLPKSLHFISDILDLRNTTESDYTLWDSKSKLINIFINNRIRIIQIFKESLEVTDSEATVREIRRYLDNLSDCTFVFLLFMFQRIFEKTDVLFNTLQCNLSNPKLCNDSVVDCIYLLIELRDEKVFRELIQMAESVTGQKMPDLSCSQNVAPLSFYLNSYFEILNIITAELVEIQYPNLDDIKFISLAQSTNFAQYECQFPDDKFTSLISRFGDHFNKEKLRAELEVVFSSEQKDRFRNLRLNELIKQMIKDNTTDILPKAFKLFTLVATIPASRTPVKGFTCRKRIKSYLENNITQDRMAALALVSIEKTTLGKLERSPSWYDDVIECLAKNYEPRIKLLYKT